MKNNLRRTVLMLCVFMGLFFLLQTDTTVDNNNMHSGEVNVQSVQMAFRPVQAGKMAKTMGRAVLLPVVYLPLRFLAHCKENCFLRALLAGIGFISFTLYSLRIIYKLDGKKRRTLTICSEFCK